jgi:DNA-binding NarL/FixJ family response regulator
MPSADPAPGDDARSRNAADRAQRARALAAHGRSNKVIAAELGVAESTISRLTRAVGLPSMKQAEEALRVFPRLTSSERFVLAMAASGSSADVIATARGTSPRTIANQLRSAYDKLGVGSRRELRALIGADGE